MKCGIIGAGPSGLTMAMFLNGSCEVLEKSNKPGGHASSFLHRGYTFDYGPHIMFSRNKEILNFMIATLGENVHQSKRNNKISFKNKFIKYPFENDLKSLPIEDNYDCLYSYLFNPYKKKFKKPRNLEEWLLAHFGRGICDKYLFPYNRKVWNIPVSRLSMVWAERIPNPPPEDIIKSSLGFETEGYVHQLYYHYPLKGGYQAISDKWAKKVDVTYSFPVIKITKTKRNTFQVTDGSRVREYDMLVSTMPIHELVKIVSFTVPDDVKEAVEKLIVNPMYVVSLGIKGEDENKYTAVYFPEEDFLVNRISFPKTFSPHNAPKGHYSIQAEITCRANSSVWKEKDEKILDHVKDGLLKRGIITNRQDIVCENVHRSKYAYVVYNVDYEKNAQVVRDWFEKQKIFLVGRFSYFEYVNIDGVVARSMEIAEKINRQKVNLDKFL